MKIYRWQILILCITGFIVGILLILERQGGLLNNLGSQPATGGVYTEALVGSIQRLNPLIDSGNNVDQDLDRLLFSGLLRFDSQGNPQADLAKSWGISIDGTIYNFELKENVKWHDGQPLTTDDVIFTIDLMSKGGDLIPSDLSKFWSEIDLVKLDSTHMQFVLPEPFAPFLDYLTFGVLPKHIFDGLSYEEIVNSDYNLQPIGSGPYQFKDLSLDGNNITGITLETFSDYFDPKPFISEIVFRYYADSQTALQAYKDGYVQGISQVTSDTLPDVLTQTGLSLYSARLPEISLVLLNLNDPSVSFLQDVKVRKALLLGINRQHLINEVFNGQAIKADGVIFPGTWAYLESAPSFDYDPEQAKDLLKQRGYLVTGDTNPVRTKDGVAIKFVLSYPDDDLHKKIAEMIQADWKNLDIDVTLEPVTAEKFITDKLNTRGYQAALVDLNLASTPDPDPYPFWDQGQITGGQNYSQWSDRTVSDTLEQARVTTDVSERTRLYHNFQYLFADQLPALPLYYPVYNYAVDNQVQGITLGPLFETGDRFANITSWYLLSSRTSTESK